MNLMKAMTTLSGLTFLSRIAGFIRDILSAAIMGAGPIADAFFVALKLPNFFRRVSAEGAFSVSFIPLYTQSLKKEGQEKAQYFALNSFYIMSAILGLLTVIFILCMPWVIYLIAPGFKDDPTRYKLALELSMITFPYLLCMSLSALLGGVLNSHGKFAPFAMAPILFNLTLISVLVLHIKGVFETAGHAMAWGVFAAGLIQLFWLIFCAYKNGFRFYIFRPKFDNKIQKLLKLMGPGVVGAGVMHINLIADLIIASFLKAGSISYLYYADRLQQLPIGIIGVAIGTALLPMLSASLNENKTQQAKSLYNRALEYSLLLGLPASIALLLIPIPLITVLFERGAFSAQDTVTCAAVLSFYALGLPAYLCTKVFSTVFWAQQDTKTPVKISIISTALNIVLSLIFVSYIGVPGIALGTSLAGGIQIVLYIFALKKNTYTEFSLDLQFKSNLPRIFFASIVMGLSVALLAKLLSSWLLAGLVYKILLVLALVLGGMLVYGLAVIGLGVLKIQDVRNFIRR